ncbi:unnamed protein product [Porites lobata]|uniref:Zinc finger Ran-binding domain-containing protein 2 n=1 Tax=Porites lobata TaxID=104759 RepID=A0ABN8PJH6_9CNID|nr:unnamed protein product [Porites lobata]
MSSRVRVNNGDWVCPDKRCGNVNFARRTSCNRCGRDKASKDSVKFTGTQIGKQAAAKSKGLFSAEDWMCSKCGNVNWARRSDCNMCGQPKYSKVESRTGYGGGFNEREGVEYIQRQDSDDEFDEFGRKKKRKQGESQPVPQQKVTNAPPAVEEEDDDDDDDDDEGGDLSKYNLDDEDEEDDEDGDLSKYQLDDDSDTEPKDKGRNSRSRSGSPPSKKKRRSGSSSSSSSSSRSRSRSSRSRSRSRSRSKSSSSSSRSRSKSKSRSRSSSPKPSGPGERRFGFCVMMR